MRLGRIGRDARAVGYVFLFVVFLGLTSEPVRAREENGKPSIAADRLEPASDARRGARHPVWLHSEGAEGAEGAESATKAPILVYPPNDTSKPAPLVVLLHGMCGHPENECPWFAGAPTSSRYLVCPRADLSCRGGGSIWSGSTRTRGALVQATTARLERTYGNRVGRANGTLIGFSLGAFVALDVAQESHGEWPRLLLIGAFVKPNAKKLKTAGVESVLFASGDWDMSRDEMRKQARLLSRQGVRAKYVGMGPVGHWFGKDPKDMDTWLESAFEWMEEGASESQKKDPKEDEGS